MKYDSVVYSLTLAAYAALLAVVFAFESGLVGAVGCAVFVLSCFCACTPIEKRETPPATHKTSRQTLIVRRETLIFMAHSQGKVFSRRAKNTATWAKSKEVKS